MPFFTLIKHPSTFLPVAMSLAAPSFIVDYILLFGVARETDEGTAAHIFKTLMVAEVPIVAFFATRWLSRVPKQALQVLALQIDAVLVALAPFSISTYESKGYLLTTAR